MSKKVSRLGDEWRSDAGVHTSGDGGDAASLYSTSGARKYLNRAERTRALAAIATLPDDHALFALTLAWSGARVSEVLALTAASFQLDAGLVAIRTLKRRRHAIREIPLPPDLLAALDAHFHIRERQTDLDEQSCRIWPWCRQTAWRLIKLAMTEAGLTGRAASPRGLRHAFGVGSLQAGVPLNIVQRWLGHSRISTTAIYAAAAGPEEIALAMRFWLSVETDDAGTGHAVN